MLNTDHVDIIAFGILIAWKVLKEGHTLWKKKTGRWISYEEMRSNIGTINSKILMLSDRFTQHEIKDLALEAKVELLRELQKQFNETMMSRFNEILEGQKEMRRELMAAIRDNKNS